MTRAFGSQTIVSTSAAKVVGADTVMRMLERNARVSTRYSGGFVESIDGLAGAGSSDWFYYVNGVQAPKGAADTKLRPGDHVWWDRHDWTAAESIPAVVGAFPEPFADGYGGRRWPLRIECTQRTQGPCNAVQSAFAGYHLVASEGCLLCSQYNQSLRVVVGPYDTLSSDPAAALLAGPVGTSGVYARFVDGGRRLALLNAAGDVVQRAGAGAGIVAAVRWHGQPPVWYVTGTDAAGVGAAVSAFNASTLDGHFAVAVVAARAIPLPAP